MISSTRTRTALILASAIASLLGQSAPGATITWSGGTSTDFEVGTNWVGNAAPANDLTTDIGVFSGTVTANLPQITASRSLTGLSFSTSTGGWTLGSNSSANLLTLGANGITTNGQSSGTNTISANLAIGAGTGTAPNLVQTWNVGNGGTLNITGSISLGSSGTPAGLRLQAGGTGNGTLTLDPSSGNSINLYSTSNGGNAALLISKNTNFGSAANSTSSTNIISNNSGSPGLRINAGATLAVNSGTWKVSDTGSNNTGALTGTLTINGGTYATGGARYLGQVNTGVGGTVNVAGGTLLVTGGGGSSANSGFLGFGTLASGTPAATGQTTTMNISSGFLDVAKGVGTMPGGVSAAAMVVGGAASNTALVNQSGGITQVGVTTGYNVFTGAANANAFTNLVIGSNAASNSNAYTITGGRLVVAGSLSGVASSGGVSNFNFMGGTLTAGTITATNLGSSSTATASANQVAASSNIGTLVNYGGTLAPGGDLLTITADSFGNSSIATTPVSGRTAITGNYVVTSGALAVNLGGTTASSAFQDAANTGRFGNVTINGVGTNTIGGNLLVKLIDGTTPGTTFAPTSGNTFKIVSYTGAGASNGGIFSGNNVGATNLTTAIGGTAVTNGVIATDGLTAFGIAYNNTAATGGVTLGNATTNEWNGAVSGSNWNTAANWTAMAPNTSAFIAKFADGAAVPSGANTADLADNLTIQGLQFNSTARQYTIGSGNGSGLTLDASAQNTTNPMTNAVTAASTFITDGSAGASGHSVNVPITLNSNLVASVTNAAETLTIGGAISGSARTLTKTGAGSLILTAANGYTGTTTISGGVLQLGNGGTTGSLSPSSAIVAHGTFAINRSNDVVQGTDFSGAAITGSGGVAQIGAGTTTLNATNNYTGPTAVSAGQLNVSGSISGTTSISLTGGTMLLSANNVTHPTNSSSTVTNTGVPSVALAGGKLKIADSLSGLSETFGALTLSATSTLDFGAGTNNRFNFDSLSITSGVLNVLNWSVGDYAGADPDDGTTTNDRLLFTQSASSFAAQINFYSGDTTTSGFLGTGTQIVFGGSPGFEIVPVPEPSNTALLGAATVLALVGFRERRRLRLRRSRSM